MTDQQDCDDGILKEIVALKEEQEKERCRLAEESFKEWLEKANEKSKSVPKSPSCSTSKCTLL